MTCRPRSALAVLLALCLAPPVYANTTAQASVEVVSPTEDDEASLADALRSTSEQAIRGDTLGAAIAYERLLQDPRLATLDAEIQGNAWYVAAQVARHQKDMALAEARFERAVQVTPGNASARLMLAEHQLTNNRFDAAADSILLALESVQGPPDISAEFVWHLQNKLKEEPAKRLAVLQALFDHDWKNEGVEPVELWVYLAILQVEAGRDEAVPTTLERIDAPLTLVALRADKRFDRYLRRDDPRFDPVAAARRHIDRLRVEAMLSPGFNQNAVQLAYTLLVAGETEEVVGMTAPLAERAANAGGPPPQGGRYVAWMLDNRSVAQRRLGQLDEAVESQLLAVRVADPQADPVSQKLNLGRLYVALDRPALAREAIDGLGNLSSYGEGARDVIALRAALQLNDTAAAQAARERLEVQREQNPGLYREGLVADNRLDDAAASLIRQLADPMERTDVLLDMQDLRYAAPPPGEVEHDARWAQLRQRADVRAAVAKVGHIDTYALYND